MNVPSALPKIIPRSKLCVIVKCQVCHCNNHTQVTPTIKWHVLGSYIHPNKSDPLKWIAVNPLTSHLLRFPTQFPIPATSDLSIKNEQLSDCTWTAQMATLRIYCTGPFKWKQIPREASTKEHQFNVHHFKEIPPLCSIPLVSSQYSQCWISSV